MGGVGWDRKEDRVALRALRKMQCLHATQTDTFNESFLRVICCARGYTPNSRGLVPGLQGALQGAHSLEGRRDMKELRTPHYDTWNNRK